MVRTLPFNSETRPELSRILAIAVAIAVHAFALLLLLIPMAAPPVQALVEKRPGVILIPPKEKPVEVVPVENAKPKPVTHERISTQKPDTTIERPSPVIVDDGTVATEIPSTVIPGPSTVTGPVDSGPIPLGNLAYIKATPPPYPRAEVRAGVQGTVMLKVLVDVDGKPIEVVVQQSSGNRNLDRSARDHVLKNWLFQPAMRDGNAVQAYGMVPVVFSMQ